MTKTPQSTHFFVPSGDDIREQTEATIGTLTPKNVVGKMLRIEAGRHVVATFVESVLRLKSEEGYLDEYLEALRHLRTSEDTFELKQINDSPT